MSVETNPTLALLVPSRCHCLSSTFLSIFQTLLILRPQSHQNFVDLAMTNLDKQARRHKDMFP